jgi:glycosyltransferase involved in cell wall biosynthesis
VLGTEGRVYDELRSLGAAVDIVPMASSFNLVKLWRSYLSFVQFLVGKREYDFIHAHSTIAGIIVRIAKIMMPRTKAARIIITVHGWPFAGDNILKNLVTRLIESMLCSVTDTYFFVSNFDRRLVKGTKLSNIQNILLYNSSDDFGLAKKCNSERIVFTMVARDDLQKDYNTLFKSLSLLDFSSLNIIIRCIGRGTDFPDFKQRAVKYSSLPHEYFEFVGPVNNVREYLRDTDVFTLITNYEGMPISIIEAMSVGLPVVASNVGGINELIHNNENGILVEKQNSIEVANALYSLGINSTLRLSFGRRSRLLWEKRHSLSKYYDKLDDYFGKNARKY